MDNLVTEIFKVFSHLAREIQTYVFSGAILVFNVFLIDNLDNSSKIYDQLEISNYSILILVIVSYLLGHIIMAVFCMIIEFWGFDKFLYRKIFKKRFQSTNTNNPVDEKINDKVIVMNKHEKLYYHFIERNVNLSIMRWNYSAAFFLVGVIDLIYYFSVENTIKQLKYISIISFFISWCLMILHIFTQKENAEQIKSLKDLP